MVLRDGIEAAVDVVLPPGDGPFPAVVTRTPYMRGEILKRPDVWVRLVDSGYAYVVADVRGRGDSGGTFTPFVQDSDDGYDTIEWVARQSWCTGRIGMVGVSYEALTQWWAVRARPPHLTCIAPMAVGAAKFGDRPLLNMGAPQSYWMWWMNLVTGRTLQHSGGPSWGATLNRLPLRDLHEHVGSSEAWPLYVAGEIDYLSDDFALSPSDWAALDIPVLLCSGWWDDQTTLFNWEALQSSPAASRARLLIGAWDHDGNEAPRPVLGGLDLSASVIDTVSYVERFLAEHLKPDDPPSHPIPRHLVFRTGGMAWETPDEWPSRRAEPTSWYLGGDAGSGPGDLATEAGPESVSSYTYDPRSPGRDFGDLDALAWSDPPLDARYRLRREDTLAYISGPLSQPVDVSGLVAFEAYVSLDCPDTDLCVKLHDVHPDGRAIERGGFGLGTLRISRRDGTREETVEPGRIVRAELPLVWLHHTFEAGHRIALTVCSSDYPTIAPNLNTGEPWQDGTTSRVAHVTVHQGGEHPSRLILPIESQPVERHLGDRHLGDRQLGDRQPADGSLS